MVTPNGDQGVAFGPVEKGGLPGGDWNMSQSCQPSTSADSSTLPPLALTYNEPSNDLTPKDENDHKYVGLVNQAMTCYLNSLLQTLYMTPEFRNAIYEWEYTSNRNEMQSIPCQLQKLFLLLQTSDADSLETKELTAAFGWSSNEAYDQHDVQELCRLMFDALEMRWKGSKHEKLIEQLYRGTMEDFVACRSCGRESVKPDVFLDLPLAVKPFGATEAFKSVEEALGAFVQPELLDGANQYMCETCKSKQDAHKGLRITSFPYLLTMQLKRFDFDYTTFNRIKLNDRVSFPDLLDLNPFVHKPEEKKEKKEDAENEPPSETPMEEESNGMEIGKGGVGHRFDGVEADRLLENGPFVYELFSVMVHQGNAAGGHYFAYIKNMDVSEWYCFNDTRVEIATPMEVEKSFGGMQGGWTNSNTNAYMLMYRQVRKDKNATFIRTVDLPRHIIDLKKKWKEQEEAKEEQRKYDESLLKITVYANGILVPHEISSAPFDVSLPRENTVETLSAEVIKHFGGIFKEKGLEGPSRKNGRLIQCSYGKNMRAEFVSPADMKKITRVRELLGSYLCEKDFKDYRIVMEKGMDKFEHVDAPAKQFAEFFRHDNDTCILYVDGGSPGEETNKDRKLMKDINKVENTLMFKIIDRFKYSQKLRIELPSKADLCEHNESMAMDESSEVTPPPPPPPQTISMEEQHKLFPKLTSVEEYTTMNTFPMEVFKEREYVQLAEEPTPSVASSVEDMDDDCGLSGESVCNNTPQMSPVVSEGEDGWEPNNLTNNLEDQQMLFAKITSLGEYTAMENVPHPYVEEETHSTTSSKTIVAKSEGDKKGEEPIIHILEEKDNIILLDVDKRSRIRELRQWLATRCDIEPGTFSFHVTYGDTGSYESNAKDEDALDSWRTIHKLVMKLRPALKEDEKMVKLYRFEMEENDRDKWRLLFEIPLSPNSKVLEVKKKCQKLFRDKYQEQVEIDQIHLRCLKQKRAELGNDETVNQRLGVQWNENIYVHLIPPERIEEAKEGKQAVFVRRFRPSCVEVDKIDFVMVDPSLGSSSQVDNLKESISHRFNVAPHNIQFTYVYTATVSSFLLFSQMIVFSLQSQSAWEKWPFSKTRIDLHENVSWNDNPFKDNMLVHTISHFVLYFRDKSEEKKTLTEEDKKLIRIRDMGQTATVRRKERALKIQMSSFSES
ncbi:hypothetical protein PRIPAC_88465 [Pristionchus pacificus]|uniref:Ubiquitin carboxyl-terminal hydrolase 47 n=1 Tax=Pristionchus pacificus TaxID=54126 RepID=A0A2A6B7Q8_PRIPA|nr:hypothetical protein PRIPAC_88465 [Pristionchus pacificus]|eukprot:PDM61905.1 Peptidase [Pristionchus pacificus]